MTPGRVSRAPGVALLSVLLACGAVMHAPASASSSPATAIAWREWSPEAFQDARASRRLVLMDLMTTWCHSCRVMAESTYTDPLVVAAVNAAYVAVRVDHDVRPDVGDRYLGSGWPTTAVLGPEGHLLATTTYLPPHALREFLAQATRFYRMNRTQVDLRVAEAERSVAHTWDPDTLEAPSMSDEEYVTINLDALRDLEDTAHGGFGAAPKTPRWDAISFLLRAADARRDDGLRALAVRSAASALALQDSVDGGFFRAALSSDWSRPRYERLLSDQASAIGTLTRVWKATGEARFREAVERIQGFLGSSRLAEGGLFGADRPPRAPYRNSMGPDARRRDGSWVDGEVYFGLGRSARETMRPPPVADLVVADATAAMIAAQLRAAIAFESDPLAVEVLRRHEDVGRLRGSLGHADGSFDHAEDGRRSWGRGFLADQAAVGLASLEAFECAGFAFDLEAAERTAAWMREHLEDPIGGGFRYAPRDSAAIGRLKAGDKPAAANVEAATFFLRLYWLTGDVAYRDVARRTSDYLRSGPALSLDPARAELVVRLNTEPVRLAVLTTGRKEDHERFLALRVMALRAPAAEVIVRTVSLSESRPGGKISWPLGLPKDAAAPAVYRWTKTGWRGPVTDPAKVADLLDTPGAN